MPRVETMEEIEQLEEIGQIEEKDSWTNTWINPSCLSKVAAGSQVRYHRASAMAQAAVLGSFYPVIE